MEIYYVSLYHKRLENKMQNLILVKYDWSDKCAQSFQIICSVYVDLPRVILLVTVFFLIQPNN